MPIKTFTILFLGLLLTACGDNTSESLKNIQQSKFNQVMEKAGKETYQPPKDGRLTEEQIKMYIEVKKREADLSKTEAEKIKNKLSNADQAQEGTISSTLQGLDALQQIAGFATLDIRAAQELNYNSAEYQWVKDAIVEASSNAMMGNVQNMNDNMIKAVEDSIADLEKTRDKSKDPQTKAVLDQQINDAKMQMYQMKQNMENDATLSPAAKYNLELYAKYEKTINLYQNEISKWDQLNN